MSQAELVVLAAKADERAAMRHITTERGIAAFAALTLVAGIGFEDRPRMHRFLSHPGLDPQQKLDLLLRHLASQTAPGR